LQRRRVLAALGALAILPRAVAQAPQRRPRVAILMYGSPANFRSREEAFKREMRALGHGPADIDYAPYAAYGQADLLAQVVRTVVDSRPDVILSAASPATRALLKATSEIPIVIGADEEPIAEGYAQSLARPGRNVTGVASSVLEHVRRHMEVLLALAPRITYVTALLNPDNPAYAAYRARLEAANRPGMKLVFADAKNDRQIERAFLDGGHEDKDGMLVMNDPFFYTERSFVTEVAARAKCPTVYPLRGYVEAGGLASYGPNREANFARAAHYVDRILKGARPADMAIEPSPRLELVLNRYALATLRITPPAEILKEAVVVG
jgi:putative ABC transport system substrate-binding protein